MSGFVPGLEGELLEEEQANDGPQQHPEREGRGTKEESLHLSQEGQPRSSLRGDACIGEVELHLLDLPEPSDNLNDVLLAPS